MYDIVFHFIYDDFGEKFDRFGWSILDIARLKTGEGVEKW